MSYNRPIEYLSLIEVARDIRLRKISSHELTSHILSRVAELNKSVNAVVTLINESALVAARAADRALESGRYRGLLHGVPCTVKDTFEMSGVRTTAGTEQLRDYVPTEDATVVERLRDSGAIIIGKTNTPPMGADWQTYNSIFGVTNNPHDLRRTPGGSSGGCAAAVCAGFSYLSVGSDMGGSIRIPASFCGIYGHKPTIGLVPSKGNIPPLPGRPSSRSGLGVRGPFARNPADLLAAMQTLGGPDNTEGIAWRWCMPGPRCARLCDYRVGFVFDDVNAPVSSDTRVILDALLVALKRGGAEVIEGWPSGLMPMLHFEAFRALSQQRKASRSRRRRLSHGMGMHSGEITSGSASDRGDNTGNELAQARAVGVEARAIWREYFRTHDAFLLPNSSTSAFHHDLNEDWDERWLPNSEGPQPYFKLPFWVSFATLAGLPATSAPVGFTGSDMPVGVQIIGPYLEDATPIDLAGRIADHLGGFRAPKDLEGGSKNCLSSTIEGK